MELSHIDKLVFILSDTLANSVIKLLLVFFLIEILSKNAVQTTMIHINNEVLNYAQLNIAT